MLPCAGGTQRLTQLVGEGWAKRMILCGERIGAEQAQTLADFDGDGVGNRADQDDDGDDVLDINDAFPFDFAEALDTDGDGIGNNGERTGN